MGDPLITDIDIIGGVGNDLVQSLTPAIHRLI